MDPRRGDVELDRSLGKLQERLPESMRKDWIVVPRPLLWQLFAISLVIGASFAVSVVGAIWDIRPLRYAWPIGVVLLFLNRRMFWMSERRHEEQLRALERSQR